MYWQMNHQLNYEHKSLLVNMMEEADKAQVP